MASLGGSFRIGNTGVSSLLRSASTLQNDINTYQDTQQRIAFENNPSDDQLATYLDYLQKRIGGLSASGRVTDLTKATNMQQAMRTAIQANTSFNIQNESIQVLAGNATDQQKLDYIGQAYSRAQSIGDVKLAQSLESQAYNLQQSIAYHAQAAQTAAQVQFSTDQAAMKQGYMNAIHAVDSAWQDVVTAFKNGEASDVQSALKDFTKAQAPIFKQLGVDLPSGAQLTMAGVAQAVLSAKYAYYENGATALSMQQNPNGGPNQDALDFQQKAQDIVRGITTVDTPAGAMNIAQVNKWATAPTNLYSTATTENGQNTLRENAVTGYQVVKGQVIPTTNGSVNSAYDTLGKDQQNAIKDQLQKLGFTPAGSGGSYTENGQIKVQLSDAALKWMGGKNSDLQPGDIVTLIPTNGGKGFQFQSNSGSLYGISLDSRGLAGLYKANSDGGGWSPVQGQYGFNPNTTANSGTAALGAPNLIKQAAGAASGTFASSVIGNQRFGLPAAVGPKMTQRTGGGFNFTNAQGQAISAATYSQLTGTPFRTLLTQMANSGDQGAATVLGFVGNDYGYDPTKATSYQNSGLYNALTWGASGVKTLPSAAPASVLGNGAQLRF